MREKQEREKACCHNPSKKNWTCADNREKRCHWKSNDTIKDNFSSSNDIWSHFFYVFSFGFLLNLVFFFSILFFNIKLVENWESWFSPTELHWAHDQGNTFERLTWVILTLFLLILNSNTSHSIFFLISWKIIIISCVWVAWRQAYSGFLVIFFFLFLNFFVTLLIWLNCIFI